VVDVQFVQERRLLVGPKLYVGTSVNPARSARVAFFNGNGAPGQLWVFWLAPLVGSAIAGIAYLFLFGKPEQLAERPVRDDFLTDS
jgi:aquaporin Z